MRRVIAEPRRLKLLVKILKPLLCSLLAFRLGYGEHGKAGKLGKLWSLNTYSEEATKTVR